MPESLSHCLYMYVPLFAYLCVFLLVCLHVVFMPVCLSSCPYACLLFPLLVFCLSLFCPSLFLPVCLPVCLHVCLPACMSAVCPFACMSILLRRSVHQ